MPEDPYAKYGGTAIADPYAKYGGSSRQSGAPTPPARGGRGGGAQGQSNPEASQLSGGQVGEFLGGIADTTVKTIPAAAKMAYHGVRAAMGPPTDVATSDFAQDIGNIAQSHVNQGQKAKEAWKRGDRVEAVGHGLAAAVPVVGPAATEAAETIGGELEYGDQQHPERPTGVVREPQVARGLGQSVGLIGSASPKNIVEPVVSGIAGGIGKIPVPDRLTPEGLMQSSLKPGLSAKNRPKIGNEVRTALRERIPTDSRGLRKSDVIVDDLNAQVKEKVDAKSGAIGPDISPLDVTKPVNRLRPTFSNQVNPSADLSAIKKSKGEFLEKHSTPFTGPLPEKIVDNPMFGKVPTGEPIARPNVKQPLTVSEAQAEKQGTYTQLRKKYGELGSADVEAQKALARGLKDEIVKRVPEVAALNAREGALIELQTELEKMVAREGNKNILGLIPSTMARDPYGFLATILLDNPAIKSRIAILLDRARNATSAQGIGRGAATTAPASVPASIPEEQDQRFNLRPPTSPQAGTIFKGNIR